MIQLLNAIASTIVLYFHSILNIDILGVNLFFVFASFITILLLIFLIIKFKGSKL